MKHRLLAGVLSAAAFMGTPLTAVYASENDSDSLVFEAESQSSGTLNVFTLGTTHTQTPTAAHHSYQTFGEKVYSNIRNADNSSYFISSVYLPNKTVTVSRVGKDGKKLSSIQVTHALSIYGGVCLAENGFYVVSGETNRNDSKDKEVLRVEYFDYSGKLKKSRSIYGANTNEPFEGGSCRFAIADGHLFVYTCHTMFSIGDGTHHQANMIFRLNAETLDIEDSYYDIASFYSNYVSHSFNQFITTDGKNVYRVDHGDGYPRGIALSVHGINDRVTSASFRTTVFDIPGEIGENYTGVTVGGVVVTGPSILVAGSTVDHSSKDTRTRNIFVTVTNKSSKKTEKKSITNYSSGSKIYVENPHLVNYKNGHALLLWEEVESSADGLTGKLVTKIALLNNKGEIVSPVQSYSVHLSDAVPAVQSDGSVVWPVIIAPRFPNPDGSGWPPSEEKLVVINPGFNVPETKTEFQPVYRVYNKNDGDHLYTADESEYRNLVKVGWSDESNNGKSPAWYQPADLDTPIYRVYNPNSGEHHLTMDKGEVDALVKAGWKKDDNELNGYSGSDRIKLYRAYNPSLNGFHHYTANKNEFDSIVKVGWKDESHQEFWVAPANASGK